MDFFVWFCRCRIFRQTSPCSSRWKAKDFRLAPSGFLPEGTPSLIQTESRIPLYPQPLDRWPEIQTRSGSFYRTVSLYPYKLNLAHPFTSSRWTETVRNFETAGSSRLFYAKVQVVDWNRQTLNHPPDPDKPVTKTKKCRPFKQ